MTQKPSIGRVTGVHTKNGETFVDVEMGPTRHEPKVRFAALAPGLRLPPKEGNMVEVYETERGLFARFCHTPPEFPMPELEDDSFVFRFSENTEILFSNDGNGNYTVKLRGNDSVTVQSDGDATVKGANSVTVESAADTTVTGSDSVNVESTSTVNVNGGDVTIDGDTITLGDGSEQVVTDIDTTTNSDGYVTDVTPIYSNKVNIE